MSLWKYNFEHVSHFRSGPSQTQWPGPDSLVNTFIVSRVSRRFNWMYWTGLSNCTMFVGVVISCYRSYLCFWVLFQITKRTEEGQWLCFPRAARKEQRQLARRPITLGLRSSHLRFCEHVMTFIWIIYIILRLRYREMGLTVKCSL